MTTHPAILPKPSLANWLTVIALSVIWGAAFMSVSMALKGFGPLTVAAGRIVIAALVLLATAWAMGLRLPRLSQPQGGKIWLHIIGMALFSNALPFFLLSWAQKHVASGFAGITMAAVPLFTMLIAHRLVPGEKMTRWKVAGFGLGIAGVVVLIGPRALAVHGDDLEAVARMICIAAALSYSIGGVVTRLCPPVPLVAFSAAALLVAAVMIVPLALTLEGLPDLTAAGTRPILALLYLGLGPTALATMLLVRVIQTAGPTFLTQSNYQVPVWSVVFGTLFLGEKLPATILLALALILAGLSVSRIGLRAGGWLRTAR